VSIGDNSTFDDVTDRGAEGVPLSDGLSVHLAAVSDAQYENDEFVIFDVVDDAVVANADAALTGPTRKLNVALRPRIHRQPLDGVRDPFPLTRMNLAERFRCGGFVDD
jgi:hypothetical protein